MLTSLNIKDFAIIDELALDLGPGLCAMTGETGAGKTIIVEALKLVLGSRASTDAVRTGKDRASVTAVFDTSDMPDSARRLLDDAGIECGEELIVHRVVGAQGKGKISINGVPVSAATLRQVAEHLVDISSQHEHQLLLDEARYPLILDEFAGLAGKREVYSAQHRRWVSAASELAEIETVGANVAEREEFLRFQLKELTNADVKPGEDCEIAAEFSRLKHSVLLEERTRSASDLVGGDATSAIAVLQTAVGALEQCVQYEPLVAGWIESIGRARIEAEEVARDLSQYADGVGSEPGRAAEIEERLYLIRGLARKHGGTVETMLARRDEIGVELAKIENHDETIAAKRAELDGIAKSRRAAAKALSGGRSTAADSMGDKVASELGQLGMKKTQFAVKVSIRPEEGWEETGPDSVEFLISPNVGEPLRGLARIASGGELSRFMLALKGALVAGSAPFGTSVFDEVDAGIGGAIAAVVGRKLKGLASSRQVVCITHLPQVASFADSHVRISKRVAGGRTVTVMEGLGANDRVDEIARMLGGEKMTDATVAHAKEMLNQARKG